MSFPATPANGQTFFNNGILYVYSSTDGSWTRQQAANTQVSTLTFASNGAATFSSNVTVSGTLTATGVASTGKAIAMAMVFGG